MGACDGVRPGYVAHGMRDFGSRTSNTNAKTKACGSCTGRSSTNCTGSVPCHHAGQPSKNAMYSHNPRWQPVCKMGGARNRPLPLARRQDHPQGSGPVTAGRQRRFALCPGPGPGDRHALYERPAGCRRRRTPGIRLVTDAPGPRSATARRAAPGWPRAGRARTVTPGQGQRRRDSQTGTGPVTYPGRQPVPDRRRRDTLAGGFA